MIVMTGASGLLGTRLSARLTQTGARLRIIDRRSTCDDWAAALAKADAVVHLAGVTKPKDDKDFDTGNRGTTRQLADAVMASGRALPVLYASSIRANEKTPYGCSKAAAEQILFDLHQSVGSPILIFRLPSFFGVWSPPDYNSAIATFCHQAASGLPISARTPAAQLELVELDTVADAFVNALEHKLEGAGFRQAGPTYHATIGEVIRTIEELRDADADAAPPTDETGLRRGLRKTYEAHVSALQAVTRID